MVQDGSFNNLIDSILNPNKEASNLPDLINQSEMIKDMALELANSVTTGQKHLSYEQVIAFNNLNKAVYKLYKDYTSGVLESARDEANKLIDNAKRVSKYHKASKVKNELTSLALDAISPRDIIAYMCGGTHTKAFKTIYGIYKNSYINQISKYVEFIIKNEECVKTIKNSSYKKVEVNGIKMNKYVLFQFYLNLLSPDNTTRMKNSNLSYTINGATQSISYDALSKACDEYLTSEEKADLNKLLDLYNGEIKEYIEQISEKILGFKVSRENYYPIVSSEMFKIKNFANPESARFNINALDNGRLKKLSNRAC